MILRTTAFLLLFNLSLSAFAQTNSAAKDDEIPPGTLFGQTNVISNYVEKGLTQTDSGPAIQANVGYKWTLAKAGLWASNVKYSGVSDTVIMRLYGTYDFVFTSNTVLVARLDYAKYSKEGSRDGTIMGLDLNMFGYHVIYEKVTNWEATGSDTARVGARKEFPFLELYNFDVGGGYNMVDAEQYSDYFDLRAGFSYRYGALKLELSGTFASNFQEFQSRAGPFAIFGIEATF